MCWESSKKPRYKIADKDIIVYKILRSNESFYYWHEYKTGIKQPKIKIRSFKQYSSYVIEGGYHSYISKEIASANYIYGAICKFKIPKGTRMSPVDEKGTIVSETIVRC